MDTKVSQKIGVMDRRHVREQGLMRLGTQGGRNQPILGWERKPDQSSFDAGPISGNISLSRGNRNAKKTDNDKMPTMTMARRQKRQR